MEAREGRRINGWMDGWKGRWKDEWKGGWKDGWWMVDGQMDG